MHDIAFYDRRQYFAELTRCARQAASGDRLLVMAMTFDPLPPDGPVGTLLRELAAAAGRGADVTVVVDAHTFMLADSWKPGPLLYGTEIKPRKLHRPFSDMYAVLEALRAAGGRYSITNRPLRRFSNPFTGRSHIKLALTGDRVFIGGHNLQFPDELDLMVSWQDADTASQLEVLASAILSSPTAAAAMDNKNRRIDVNEQAAIYVDAGVPRQSVILEQAYRLIDEAREHIFVTCQYFPGGATADRLLAASRRGVQVDVYYSSPSEHGAQAPFHWVYEHRERLRLRLPPEFRLHRLPPAAPKLHAKILASESAGMIGSHNYVVQGVNYGTAEIALRVRQSLFAGQLTEQIMRQIKPFL